ncbi:hypothetical protein D3C87_978920 [compost metagenome]
MVDGHVYAVGGVLPELKDRSRGQGHGRGDRPAGGAPDRAVHGRPHGTTAMGSRRAVTLDPVGSGDFERVLGHLQAQAKQREERQDQGGRQGQGQHLSEGGSPAARLRCRQDHQGARRVSPRVHDEAHGQHEHHRQGPGRPVTKRANLASNEPQSTAPAESEGWGRGRAFRRPDVPGSHGSDPRQTG